MSEEKTIPTGLPDKDFQTLRNHTALGRLAHREGIEIFEKLAELGYRVVKN